MATTKTTTKAPLNVFEVVRKNITASDGWVSVYEANNWEVDIGSFEDPEIVQTAAIITGLIISNDSVDPELEAGEAKDNSSTTATVSVKFVAGDTVTDGTTAAGSYTLLKQFEVLPNDFASVGLDKQILRSSANKNGTGDSIQIKVHNMTDNASYDSDLKVAVTFSFILNQREPENIVS